MVPKSSAKHVQTWPAVVSGCCQQQGLDPMASSGRTWIITATGLQPLAPVWPGFSKAAAAADMCACPCSWASSVWGPAMCSCWTRSAQVSS